MQSLNQLRFKARMETAPGEISEDRFR
jgi:hypothetical protein